MESHDGHHDDEVVLELTVTRGGQVRSWVSPKLQRDLVRQLREHLESWERSMPAAKLYEDDGPVEEGAA